MSIRKYVHQVRPIQEGFLEPAIKIQKFLSEAQLDKSELFKTTPREGGALNKDIFVDLAIKGELSGVDGKSLPKVKSDDPFLVSIKNAKTKEEIPNEKFNTKPEFGLSDVEKTVDFGGQSAAATGKPKGADWEDIITSEYNKLINKPEYDLNANESAKTFAPEYLEAGKGIAKDLKQNLGLSQPMTQFGAKGGKKNLSDFWIKSGGKSGTPKTDMYTSNYNISLKKKGGSQLASGMAGETLATFNAALEYLGETREGEKEISDIMDKIEKNFTKLLTDNTIDKIRELEKKKNLSPAEKKLVGDYVTTEEFHKKLNEQIAKDLTMDNKQTFREWFVYEAMSGYKKFNSGIPLARASICVEFDDKKGQVSKSYNVTPQGKSSASKVKIYAAWKTGSGNPYSALRLGMSDYYTPMKFSFFNSPQPTETLSSIIRNEILNDNIANAILKEDIHKLDEFAILRKAMTKLKDMGRSVKTYIQGILGKIMKKVKATFNKIKTLGKLAFQKLFEFLGIKLQSVRVSDTFMFSFGNME